MTLVCNRNAFDLNFDRVGVYGNASTTSKVHEDEKKCKENETPETRITRPIDFSLWRSCLCLSSTFLKIDLFYGQWTKKTLITRKMLYISSADWSDHTSSL